MIHLPTSDIPASRSKDNPLEGSGEIVDLGERRMAAELAEARARIGPLEAEDRFQEWLGEEKQRFEEEKENQAPEMAEGFAERILSEFSERGKKFRETIAPEFHAAIDTKLGLQEEGLFARAVGFERKAQKRAGENYLKAEIDRLSERAAKAAATLPADHPGKRIALAAIEERAARAIDQNPVLKPYEKQKEAARVRGALQKVFVENLSGEERSDLDQGSGIETLATRIRLLNDLAELDETQPDTAALGPDGFGREVWLREVRRQRPDIAEGKSNADLLALRNKPVLAAAIRDRAIEDNAEALSEGGHEVTPATLYLAHLIGARGVAAMLDADPNAAAAEIDPIGASDHPQLFYAGGDPDHPRPVADILDVSEAASDGARLNDWRTRLDAVSPQLLTAIARHASVATMRESIEESRAASRAAYAEKLAETDQAIVDGETAIPETQAVALEEDIDTEIQGEASDEPQQHPFDKWRDWQREAHSRVSWEANVDPETDGHKYIGKGLICSTSDKACNAGLADKIFEFVNANDVPFVDDDVGDGPRRLLFGTQPIIHREDPSSRTSINVTSDDHFFHPGTVTHRVYFEDGNLWCSVVGEGTGGLGWFNNIIGRWLFETNVLNTVRRFGW